MTCPACNNPTYFGPAKVVDHEGEYEYVTCKRCGHNYAVVVDGLVQQ